MPSSTSHDVNGDDPGLTVGLGGHKCFSFDAAGTYGFHCNPHGFQGSIVVQ
jgi:plastocyanin